MTDPIQKRLNDSLKIFDMRRVISAHFPLEVKIYVFLSFDKQMSSTVVC